MIDDVQCIRCHRDVAELMVERDVGAFRLRCEHEWLCRHCATRAETAAINEVSDLAIAEYHARKRATRLILGTDYPDGVDDYDENDPDGNEVVIFRPRSDALRRLFGVDNIALLTRPQMREALELMHQHDLDDPELHRLLRELIHPAA